jgi:hypothetical protein
MTAARCWFGPVWGDALRQDQQDRVAFGKQACVDVVADVFGHVEHTRVEQLRAFEPSTVATVGARVGKGGAALRRVFDALAEAQKENMWARRAADRIKLSLSGQRAPTLAQDEHVSVQPLQASSAVEKLIRLEAGPYTADAKTFGLMSAMDRVEIARGLPTQMKVYAVSGVFQSLFGVPRPNMPSDPTLALPPGAWLAYLSDAATAAGHPVPAAIADARDRDVVAWGGVIDGFADRMRPAAEQSSAALKPVADGVVRRLVAEAAGIANYQRGVAARTDEGPPACPSTVPGAVTHVEPVQGGVVVTVAHPGADGAWEVRERARHQLRTIRSRGEFPSATVCPTAMNHVDATAEAIEGGVKLTLLPLDKNDVVRVQSTVEKRAKEMSASP